MWQHREMTAEDASGAHKTKPVSGSLSFFRTNSPDHPDTYSHPTHPRFSRHALPLLPRPSPCICHDSCIACHRTCEYRRIFVLYSSRLYNPFVASPQNASEEILEARTCTRVRQGGHCYNPCVPGPGGDPKDPKSCEDPNERCDAPGTFDTPKRFCVPPCGEPKELATSVCTHRVGWGPIVHVK